MTSDEAREFVELLLGYWPSPPLTTEEAKVWRGMLTKNLGGRDTSITKTEAHGWINRLLDRDWRPMAGHLESAVRAQRRRDAEAQTEPLPEGVPMPPGFKWIASRSGA